MSGPTVAAEAGGCLRREPEHLLVPGVVTEPGGVGQQVLQRDRRLRGSQDRLARPVEAFQTRPVSRVAAKYFEHRLIQLHLALLHQLHRGHGGDRLGHRRDGEDGIHRHRRTLGIPLAEGPGIQALVCRSPPCRRRLESSYAAIPERRVSSILSGLPIAASPHKMRD